MKKSKIALIVLSTLIIIPIILFQVIKTTKGQDTVNIMSGMVKQRLGVEVPLSESNNDATAILGRKSIQLDDQIVPFEEIGSMLGAGATGNNVLTFRGVTAFDANGDGLQDLFFVHSGRPLARPMDKSGVLNLDEREKAKPCMLYLNQGNDKKGNPVFKSVQELQTKVKNKKLVREELILENKYEPRNSISESPFGEGRIGFGTVAADFNGDGRNDILILNHHYGMPFTKPGLGIRIYPGANHLGREDKNAAEYIETNIPEFLQADMEDGMYNTYREELEGQNTLYLNIGDQDNDGIPEWKLATEDIGFNTNYASASGTVADIDRDGDLDLYIANFVDPDFWGFGAERFAGQRNTLWVNQLAETGRFYFEEKGIDYGVSGLLDKDELKGAVALPTGGVLESPNVMKFNGKQIGENAEHSWSAQFTDINDDGYPDLIVANDIPNRLRVYLNEEGKSFKYLEEFNDPKYIGCWMGIASGDLNQDGKIDLLATNCGAQTFAIRNTALFVANEKEMNLNSICTRNALTDQATMNHMLFSFNQNMKVQDHTAASQIQHSDYIPPDIAFEGNVHPLARKMYNDKNFSNSIGGLEFAWNPSFFDIDNDGDLDIYMVGALNRGNDNFIGDWTGGPGRLLVNNSSNGNFNFQDKTLEYRVMDIAKMEYDANPPRRPSPGSGWHKEDYVYLEDRDAYSGVGVEASQSSNIRDIFRMHEQGLGNIATDLNNDGLMDMVVLHAAGYNSLSPDARNLKLSFMGKDLAIPPPNKVVKAPTSFEEGPTFVYINKSATEKSAKNWVKIQLEDQHSSNRNGIGSKVIVNGKITRQIVIGGQSFSSVQENLHVGLGDEELQSIEVFWSSGNQNSQLTVFEKGIKNQTVLIKRKDSNDKAISSADKVLSNK